MTSSDWLALVAMLLGACVVTGIIAGIIAGLKRRIK